MVIFIFITKYLRVKKKEKWELLQLEVITKKSTDIKFSFSNTSSSSFCQTYKIFIHACNLQHRKYHWLTTSKMSPQPSTETQVKWCVIIEFQFFVCCYRKERRSFDSCQRIFPKENDTKTATFEQTQKCIHLNILLSFNERYF